MISQKWLGLTALIPTLAMVFMDQSILPVALPTIQRELGAGDVALQWAVNAYLLVTAVLVLAGGKLGDRMGHRKLFLWGIFLFMVSSILCGISPHIGFLIGARALQGVGAALMFPAQTALLAALFPHGERGRATGVNVSVSSLFLILGPLLGGYLTEHASWRWIFWINLPLAIVGFAMALAFLPASKPSKEKIDGWGFSLFAVFGSATITALMEGRPWGWLSGRIGELALLALVSLVLLLRREKVAAHPFLDLKLFKHPIFASINLSIGITQFILMIGVFRAIYFQQVLGYTPSEAGLITFASCIPVLFMSPVGGYLSDRFSPKLPIALGFSLLIYSFLWLGFYSTPSLMSLMAALIPFGIGIPLIFTPSYSSAMGAVPPKKMGIAFGMVATLRTFASALGIAVIGLLIDTIQGAQLPTHTQREAQIAGFSAAHFILAFLLIIAFAIVLVLHHRKSAHHLPESPAEGWD